MSTHTPDGGATPGFTESAEKLLGEKLWAVHRLDRDTSGCLLCALSAESVAPWTQKLKESIKKYIFLSPGESEKSVWSVEGRIEKVGSHRFELVEGEANSQTTFAKIGKNSLGVIYEAEISTGKTHQIRIHAQKSGIAVMGDNEHGGVPFPRLMLHSMELQIDNTKILSRPPDSFLLDKEFERKFLTLPAHLHLPAIKLLVSLDRRRFLMTPPNGETDAFRIVHREWFPELMICVEKLGNVLQIMNYSPAPLDPKLIRFIAEVVECEHWFVRSMFNRGNLKNISEDTQINVQTSEAMPLQWAIKENKMDFDIRHSQGMSSGIFLDQRDNRLAIMESVHGKKVANFFSYTCGFSVAAALGGAAEVVSIDTSLASLNWGRDNFKLNDLDSDKYEFFVADSLFFLSACVKRGRKFDLIILDPPTFSRGKHGTFKLAEKLPELLRESFKSLESEGRLLITLNDETLTSAIVSRLIEEASQAVGLPFVRMERVHPPLDFEFPLERDTVLKGFWVFR